MSEAREQGLEAFERRRWSEAYEHPTAADGEGGLDSGSLERTATAADLLGRNGESAGIWTRAHQEHLERGDPVDAARCAFWLGFLLMTRGERVRGGGWIARADRLLDDAMAAAEAGGLGPVAVGIIYCAVIETCHEILDLRRRSPGPEPPSTSRLSSIGCGASSRRQRRRTERPASEAARPSPGWPGSGWPRAGSRTRWLRSGGSWTRPTRPTNG